MGHALRNPRGEPVRELTATEAKNAFGQVLDLVARDGIVAITRHERPRAVVLSIEAYDALTRPRRSALDGLKEEFDAMSATLNAPGAAARMRSVLSASPKEIGKLALKGARKRRG